MTQYAGIYAARVISNNDPMQKGRLILQVPEVLGGSTTGWAEAMFTGYSQLPMSGTRVWVMFAAGDARRPVWMGGDISSVSPVHRGSVVLAQGSTVTAQAS